VGISPVLCMPPWTTRKLMEHPRTRTSRRHDEQQQRPWATPRPTGRKHNTTPPWVGRKTKHKVTPWSLARSVRRSKDPFQNTVRFFFSITHTHTHTTRHNTNTRHIHTTHTKHDGHYGPTHKTRTQNTTAQHNKRSDTQRTRHPRTTHGHTKNTLEQKTLEDAFIVKQSFRDSSTPLFI